MMEKQLVKETGVSWKDAKDLLDKARQQTGASASDTKVFGLAVAMAQSTLEERRQAESAQQARQEIVRQERKVARERKCGYIILKKTWADQTRKVANEKSLTLHGRAVTDELVREINEELADLDYKHGANKAQFAVWAPTGHYRIRLNHQCQEYHEEDIVASVLGVMKYHGWAFRFQYDAEFHSAQGILHEKHTRREMFIFEKQ